MKSNFPGIRPSIARWVDEGVFCGGAAWKDTRGLEVRAPLSGSLLHEPESSPVATTKHIDWLTIMLIAAAVMVVATLAYSEVLVWL